MKVKFWGWVITIRPEYTPELEKEEEEVRTIFIASGCQLCLKVGRDTERLEDYPTVTCYSCNSITCVYHNSSDSHSDRCVRCSPYHHKPVWNGFIDNDPQPGDGTWWCMKCNYRYCGSSPAVLKNSKREAYRGKEPGGKLHNFER